MKGKSKHNEKKTNKNSNKRGSSRHDNRTSKCDPSDTYNSGPINDASYYFSDDDLKRQITNISFNQFAGVTNDLGTVVTPDSVISVKDTVPYAMRIELSPSAGFTGGDYSVVGNAVNLAALNMYTTLSANNAKTTNYAPQDLTTLILAVGSIISLSSHITRGFGLAYLYNQRNRAYPQQIVEVSGFDYDDLISNFADYRVRFNTIMTAANKIPIPANIPYFKKCADIYSGLYWDMEGSDLAQTYMFTPGTLWLFNEAYSEQGTGLETLSIAMTETNYVHTMDWYLTYLDQLVGSLLNSTTLNSIYADIIRVSTKEGMPLYAFTGISDTYAVLPSYVPEIRRWINNLNICGYPLETPLVEGCTKANDVVPSVEFNRIEYKPNFSFGNSGMDANFYINFDSSNPTDDEIIEATRLVARFKITAVNGSLVSTEVALPDHYVNRVLVFGDQTNPFIIESSVNATIAKARALINFDWHPALYARNGDQLESLIDLNYYTTLDFDYVKRLQDATYLGLLTIR